MRGAGAPLPGRVVLSWVRCVGFQLCCPTQLPLDQHCCALGLRVGPRLGYGGGDSHELQ